MKLRIVYDPRHIPHAFLVEEWLEAGARWELLNTNVNESGWYGIGRYETRDRALEVVQEILKYPEPTVINEFT